MEIHVVGPGDTIWSIAQRYGTSVQRIIADNGLTNAYNLVIGQALLILKPDVVHTVRRGDSLSSIAREYNTTALQLMQNNPTLIQNQNLYPGEQVAITFQVPRERELYINGYAYPHIDKNALRSCLPYLTSLTIFGYGFTEGGDLIPIDDEPLIAMAYRYRTAPIMLLSSITEEGTFSGERASYLFRNEAFQNKIIDQILLVMKEKGYLGLDVDFEYINAEDSEPYLNFLRNVTRQLNAEGYTVNVDLAPKTAANQSGLLYEGHDYPKIGAIANTVLLMTYEWGYTYGPPMAVAPIDQVRKVVQYAVTEIPVQKILMGVPNYGYDWLLPFEKGTSRADSLGNEQAVNLAAQYGAQIQYDEQAQSPFFEYWDYDRRKHVVWFEDVRSIRAKYDLIDEFSLLGAGYWNVMRPFTQNWSYVNARYAITKRVQ